MLRALLGASLPRAFVVALAVSVPLGVAYAKPNNGNSEVLNCGDPDNKCNSASNVDPDWRPIVTPVRHANLQHKRLAG